MEVVNLDGVSNAVIDIDPSQKMQEEPLPAENAEHAEQVASVQIETGAPTTPSNKREAPEHASPPKMSRSQNHRSRRAAP